MDSGRRDVDKEEYLMLKRLMEFCADMCAEENEIADEGKLMVGSEFMRDLRELVMEYYEYLHERDTAEPEDGGVH